MYEGGNSLCKFARPQADLWILPGAIEDVFTSLTQLLRLTK